MDPKLEQLLRSRKLWAASLIVATSLGLYALGEIDANRLIEAMAISAGIYMGATGLEDGLSSALKVWLDMRAREVRAMEMAPARLQIQVIGEDDGEQRGE